MINIGIMGSGSWGIALAILLHDNGHSVTVWSYDKNECAHLMEHRHHPVSLPGVYIPESISITNYLEEAIEGKDIILLAIPSQFVRQNVECFAPHIKDHQIIVNVAKGLENDTLFRLSQVVQEFLPKSSIVVLSGPSHAEEVAQKIPTAVVAASEDESAAETVQDLFMNPYFRIYTTTDVIGVELGGALKNVIALAAGISDGLGLGDNSKAALMTRGISEITRLGLAMGADIHTFGGLTGIGDLIVTCTSMHSRNRRAGILIGKGAATEEALKEVKMVVEGVHTAKAAHAFAKKYDVEMPIIEQMHKVLFQGKSAKQAVYELMMRDKKNENIMSIE